jgi:hypothetical protein
MTWGWKTNSNGSCGSWAPVSIAEEVIVLNADYRIQKDAVANCVGVSRTWAAPLTRDLTEHLVTRVEMQRSAKIRAFRAFTRAACRGVAVRRGTSRIALTPKVHPISANEQVVMQEISLHVHADIVMGACTAAIGALSRVASETFVIRSTSSVDIPATSTRGDPL